MSLWPRLKIFCFKKRTHGVFYVVNELRVNFTITDVTEQLGSRLRPLARGWSTLLLLAYVHNSLFFCLQTFERERVAVVEG